MSSAQSLMEAFIIWIITIVVALAVAIGVAMPWDILLKVMQDAGMDNAGTWSTTGDRTLLGNLIILIIFLLPILGGINFFVTAVRRQSYDESAYSGGQ